MRSHCATSTPELLFNLLAVAPGYEPMFLSAVDPKVGEPRFELAEQPDPGDWSGVLRGRVVDDEGQPVLGATVRAATETLGNSTRYGHLEGLDALAVTDADGRFALFGAAAEATYRLEARARARAFRSFDGIAPGTQAKLELGPGATVRGRLLRNGSPVSGTAMGLVQADRVSPGFAGEFTIATDAEGRFAFLNVIPDANWFVYAKMGALGTGGAVCAVEARSPGHDGDLDLGDLQVVDGLTLAGRVLSPVEHPLPPGTRVVLSREQAWDAQSYELDEQGRFSFDSLPAELYSLSIQTPGLRLSADNWSLDVLNRGSLVGWIRASRDDLIMRLEAGQVELKLDLETEAIEEFLRRREGELRGVEPE